MCDFEILEEKTEDNNVHALCQDELDKVIKGGHKVLQINYRRLQELPESILTDPVFSKLQKLHLKRNLLKSLPDNMKNLSGLVELYLHSNEIQVLPDGIKDLVSLQYLDISSNVLSHLPDSIGELSKLRKLQVSNNRLKKIPRSIGKLKRLETLELMNNEIVILPLEICNCTSLITLNVDNNKLQLLPRQLYQLTNLTELSAVGNNLLVLPNDLGKMSCLQSLYMDNNPYLCTVPASAIYKNVGFHSCGINEPTVEMKNSFCHVVIRHSETEDRSILLPAEIKMAGSGENTTLPLLELCMRTYYKCLRNSNRNNVSDLDQIRDYFPSNLHPLIKMPTSRCQSCSQEIFIAAFPIIFQATKKTTSSTESTYLLALCCSKKCLKPCFYSFNYPLVYPSLDIMNLALARA